jgi:uncharacterized membrane protein
MAFCGNCGAQTQDGVKFCPSCGQPVAQQAQPEEPARQAPAPVYRPPVMPGAPQQADIRDAQDGRTMAILAYILFFIPLLTGAHKDSPFVHFHTNQGTVLFIVAAIYGFVYGILSVVLALLPVVGWALILVLGIISVIFPILCIVGIVNAVNGKMQPLPVIGGIQVIK